MVARIKSRRAPRKKSRRGGRRKNAGRPVGGLAETKKVARARAKMAGMLPDELLLVWAREGKMDGEVLDPQQRLYAASAAAPYYKSKLQPRPAPGEQPPTYRLELDPATIAKMSSDKLEIMREVFRAIAAGVSGVEGMVPVTATADPDRYARSLRPDSPTDGRA